MLFGELGVLTSMGWPSKVKLPVLKAGLGTVLVFVRVVTERCP
jgi:hypothetical protein